MRSSMKIAHFSLVISLLVGISAGAQAKPPELTEETLVAPVPCVSLADGVLDLRVLGDVSDIVSLEASGSIGNSQGEVTLYVATKLSALPVSVSFDKQTDKAKILDASGNQTWLVPTSAGEAVMVTIPLGVGKSFEVTALSSSAGKDDPYMPGRSNRAVIKQVTSCPK